MKRGIFRDRIFFSIKLVSLFVIFTLAIFSVLAQSPSNDLRLTTSPLPINLKTTPGSTVSATLKIKNDGLQTEEIKADLMKFRADEQTGTPTLFEREPGDEYFDWVTFSENNFTLPPNEWKTITADFKVPTSASFGYYYAIVFSRAEEKVQKNERQTVLAGGAATLVLLEVDVPGAKREVQIVNFSADKKIYEFLPVTFTAKMKNTGNVHVAPRGNIFISRGNNEVATLEVNLNKGSILPNSPRDFRERWQDGFPLFTEKKKDGQPVLDEKGQQEYELEWDFSQASKLRFGKYTAKLIMVYDDGQRDVPIESQISFWVVPWRIITIFVFNFTLILGLILYVIRLRRRIKKMNEKKI